MGDYEFRHREIDVTKAGSLTDVCIARIARENLVESAPEIFVMHFAADMPVTMLGGGEAMAKIEMAMCVDLQDLAAMRAQIDAAVDASGHHAGFTAALDQMRAELANRH